VAILDFSNQIQIVSFHLNIAVFFIIFEDCSGRDGKNPNKVAQIMSS